MVILGKKTFFSVYDILYLNSFKISLVCQIEIHNMKSIFSSRKYCPQKWWEEWELDLKNFHQFFWICFPQCEWDNSLSEFWTYSTSNTGDVIWMILKIDWIQSNHFIILYNSNFFHANSFMKNFEGFVLLKAFYLEV